MFAPGSPITIPPMVSIFTRGIGWIAEDSAGSAPGSNAAQVMTLYFPLPLPSPCTVKRVWWANGATTTGGATLGVGIYSDSGSFSPSSLLVGGTATQGTASQVQFVDVTDTALAPGLYWIGVGASDNFQTTWMISSLNSSASFDARSLYYQSSVVVPASASPSEALSGSVPLCGFSTTASP